MDARGIAPFHLLARRMAAIWGCAAIASVALVGFLSLATRTHTYDAVVFAARVEAGKPAYDLINSHHLLYPWIGVPWLAWSRSRGFAGNGMEALQALNAWLGAAGVVGMFIAARLATGRTLLGLAAAVGLAGSYAWWNSAAEASVRTLGACLLIGMMAWAVVARRGPWWGWIGPGALLGLACLAHQTNALCAPALAGAALAAPRTSWRRRVGSAGLAVAVAGGVALAGYVWAGRFALGIRSPVRIVRWAAGYLNLPGPAPSAVAVVPPGPSAPVGPKLHNAFRARLYPSATMTQWERAWFGWGRTFLGVSDPAFRLGGEIPARALRTILFWGAWVIAAGLLGAWWRPVDGSLRPPLTLAVVWLAGCVPFFYWWEPGNVQFWVTSLPPVWLLGAVAARAAQDAVRAAGAAPVWRAACAILLLGVAGSLGWANATGRVVRDADAGRSSWTVLKDTLDGAMRPGDRLYVAGHNAIPVLLGYFTAHRFVSARTVLQTATGTGDDRIRALRASIEWTGTVGGRVFLLPEVIRPDGEFRELVWKPFGITATGWEDLSAGWQTRPADGAAGRRLIEVVRPVP